MGIFKISKPNSSYDPVEEITPLHVAYNCWKAPLPSGNAAAKI